MPPRKKLVETAVEEVETAIEPQEVKEEVSLGLPDLSKLNDLDKMQSLVNLMRVLPKQYAEPEENLKMNVHRIARFEPTSEQIARAREVINDPKRTTV